MRLQPIDIERYAGGNTGIDHVWHFAGPVSGPHAAILALMHGNELCGAHALAFLLDSGLRPARGALTLAFANVDAYRSLDPANPNAARCLDEDMNRVWSPDVLDGPRQSRDLARARLLRPVFDKVDLLLDLHSMQTESPPLVLSGPLPKGRAFARTLGVPAHIVADAGHANGVRLRDYGGFGDPGSQKNALLVECGQHYDPASADVAIDCCLRFLIAAGMLDRAAAVSLRPLPPAQPQRVVEVTEAVMITGDSFTFTAEYRGMEVIPRAGTVIGHDGDRPVATPYDDCVMVMPSKRQTRGQTAVRFGRLV